MSSDSITARDQEPADSTCPAGRSAPSAHTGVGRYVPRERVTSIYDGIVAIAATLLVLGIEVNATDDQISLSDVAVSFRLIIHWIVSFMMIAIFWTEFHLIFAQSRLWDGGLLTLTFAHIAALSLVPFASELAGDYPDSTTAALVFAIVMALNAFLLTLTALLLRHKRHLHQAEDSHAHLSARIRAHLKGFTAFVFVSILGVYSHHPIWGVVGWTLCPLWLALVQGRAAHRMGLEGGT